MKRLRKWWKDFSYEHEDAITVTLWLTGIIVGTVIFVLAFAVILWAFAEPVCYNFAQSFTGKYNNGLFTGCFIDVGDGKYYPIKQIMYVVGEGLKLLP